MIKNISVEIKYATPDHGSVSKATSKTIQPATLAQDEKVKKVILGAIADLTRLATLEGYGEQALQQCMTTKGQIDSFLKEKANGG